MASSALTNQDKKHYAPVDKVTDWLCSQIEQGAKVLEIGPGGVAFPKATQWIDYITDQPNIPKDRIVYRDLSLQTLPYPDKAFDFIYARHIIEDMFNPILLLSEMNRVGKAGYIETPSPIAELGRGVDGASPAYRGYHHHRFMSWVVGNELRLITKYPMVEYIGFAEERTVKWLQEGPRYWNTYYYWKDKITWSHRQNVVDFRLDDAAQYGQILNGAMEASQKASDIFWEKMSEKTPQLLSA